MKKISIVLCMLILIIASFSSCKKEKVFSRHIFWFNKATSDSLKAAGAEILESTPIDYKPGMEDKWYARTDVDYWYTSEPEFDQYGMLCVSVGLDKGETKSFKYNITALRPYMSSAYTPVEILQHMPLSQGSFQMEYATTTYTQLIWE
jgi:hypothetical protein